MSKQRITPAMIVERFLPNRTSRYEEWVCGNNGIGCVSPESFITYHFQEALENLLKEQRELCADSAYFQSVYRIEDIRKMVLNTESPLEEL